MSNLVSSCVSKPAFDNITIKPAAGSREYIGNIPHTAAAEAQVTPEVAPPVIGTLEMQPPALDEPVDLEFDAGVDEVIEVAVGVLKR